ncbi:MAG: hypothetical protein JW787_07665 [Sedimentisphaerales bacterium]|nr:hypothetical protein [Sedimentisphaerales bacterium]
MKGISLLSISMSLIFCTSAEAYKDSYIPVKNRIQWSPYRQGLISGLLEYTPYAYRKGSDGLTCNYVDYSPYVFSHGNNGLTCDTLDYSSYAFGHGRSGMIERNVNYSPYAFGIGKSGLVCDAGPGNWTTSCCSSEMKVVINTDLYIREYETQLFFQYAAKVNAEKAAERKDNLKIQKARLEKIREEKAKDPSEAIRQVLESKNIPFKTDRYLRINGKTVSVNFEIENSNIIIKFWNSAEISEFAKNDESKKNIYENYLKTWEDYCLNNLGNSKKIYNIIAGSKEEVLELFSEDNNLNSDDTQYAAVKN